MSDEQIRVELAREAKDLMDNRAFTAAIGVLKQQWYGELMNDATDESKVHNLRAKMQALEAIPALLRSMMTVQQRGVDVRRFGTGSA